MPLRAAENAGTPLPGTKSGIKEMGKSVNPPTVRLGNPRYGKPKGIGVGAISTAVNVNPALIPAVPGNKGRTGKNQKV